MVMLRQTGGRSERPEHTVLEHGRNGLAHEHYPNGSTPIALGDVLVEEQGLAGAVAEGGHP